jgi:acetyl esterase
MARKYALSFRTRLVLLLIKPFKPRRFNRMDLKHIRRARKPIPRFFLVDWVLGRPPACHKVENRSIPVRDGEIPVRIYHPNAQQDRPIVLNFHGGGWTVGHLQLSDYYCARIAREVGAVVVSVDYRLAPENKFPTAVQDAYDALCWVNEHAAEIGGDRQRIAVTGDSAGGNLSAAISLMARDLKGPKIAFQALLYPATNTRFDYASLDTNADAPILSKADVLAFIEHYERTKADRANPYLSPYRADDLSNLPPALVITCEFDPLHDDGRDYALRLREEGNETEWVDYPRAIHGMFTFPNHAEHAQEAYALVIHRFRKYLCPSPENM